MQVGAMRRVDRWLGRPLCFLLTLVRRVLPEPRPPAREDVRRVLFVKLSEMGAIALAAPAIREVHEVFPGAEAHLMCFEDAAEIATVAVGLPAGRVHRVETGGLVGTLLGLLRGVRDVRRARFDVVVDLEYLSRVGAVLSYLSGAPVRAGYHRFGAEGLYCGDLYTHRATWNPYLHVSQAMLMLVRAAARESDETPLVKAEPPALADLVFPEFRPPAESVAAVQGLLVTAGVPSGAEVLLVNPNSSDLLPLRRWPKEHFVELVQRLRDGRPGAWVVLTGAPDEMSLADTIMAALRAGPGGLERVASLVGQTSLAELLTLYTLSTLLVSADSGPPHFASLTPIHGVVLFGPETPSLYGPASPRIRALTANLACSPCIHAWNRRVSSCDDNVCMQRLRPDAVAAAALEQLEQDTRD